MASTKSKKRLRRSAPSSRPARRPIRVADLTAEDLRALIGEEVEEKLVEMFGDPDEGLEVRPEFITALKHQREQVAAGERGRPLAEVLKELHLE